MKDKTTKLNQYKVFIEKNIDKKLTFLEIRELQYLIKCNYENAEKQKYFSIINLYKKDKSTLLKLYLLNFYNKLKNKTS